LSFCFHKRTVEHWQQLIGDISKRVFLRSVRIFQPKHRSLGFFCLSFAINRVKLGSMFEAAEGGAVILPLLFLFTGIHGF